MIQTEARALTGPRPLDGIRVLDFTWVRAGPWCTRWLGALGAEVVKVEWPQNPSTRGAGGGGSTPAGLPANLNTDGHFSDTNANKLSVTLNTRTPRGQDLVRRASFRFPTSLSRTSRTEYSSGGALATRR